MRKYIIFLFLISLTLIPNIYLRISPAFLPQLDSQAKSIVEQEMQKEAAEEVKKKFPDLDFPSQIELTRILIKDNKIQKREWIEKRVSEETRKLKDRFQDKDGQTYLLEMDPANWARYTENVLKSGHPGDKRMGGKEMDMLMVAPLGYPLSWNHFLYYASAFLYKMFSFVKPVPLTTFLFFLPVFFMATLLIALYLFCFRRWGHVAAIVACFFVSATPGFIYRSSAGWFDTDVLNMLLPLCIVWAYLNAICSSSPRPRILWILLASFTAGIFGFTWVGWWFILAVILIYEIFNLLNSILIYCQHKQKDSQLLSRLLLFGSFIGLSIFWVVVFSGIAPLTALLRQMHDYAFLNKGLTENIWPNTYLTVDELRQTNFHSLIIYLGGHIRFTLAVVAMLIIYLHSARNPKYEKFEREAILIFVMWFLLMLLASLKGIRFLMFLALPMGICLGWLAGIAYRLIQKYNKAVPRILFAGLVSVFCVQSIFVIDKIEKGIFPTINTTYYNLLLKLDQSVPKNAIINSWWDFGDWYKFAGRRQVIVDGQSQELPQTYWMAKALIGSDENQAIAILRMLNNGGNKAFEIIQEKVADPYKAALLLNEVLSGSESVAAGILRGLLSEEKAKEVLRIVFAKPAPVYFIVDYHMQARLLPISMLGNWDFARAYLARNKFRGNLDSAMEYLSKLGYEPAKLKRYEIELKLISQDSINTWISRPFEFRSGLFTGKEKNGLVLFDGGVVYSPKEQKVYQYLAGEGNSQIRIPKNLFVSAEDKQKSISYADSNADYSMLIFKSEDAYKAISLDAALAESMFTKLYFLEGRGLKRFKPFLTGNIDNNYIRVFEIIWE